MTLVSILWLNRYARYGYVNTARWPSFIPSYGKVALFILYTAFAASVVFWIYAIYLSVCGWLWRKSGYLRPSAINPEFVICGACDTPYRGIEVVNLLCPKCGTRVEDLEGYYDRHPDPRQKDSPQVERTKLDG